MRVSLLRSWCGLIAWAALVLPAAAQPQATKIPRIGVLAERADPDPMLAELLQGLRELGYVEGKSIVVEKRYGQGAMEKYPGLAAELLNAKVDVLVVGGGVAARAAKQATTTVPIVFTTVGDPVAAGLVASLSHPGGNLTGLSNVIVELSGKQLELLKLAAPKIARVAVLHNPLTSEPALRVARQAAQTLRLQLQPLEVRQASDIAQALAQVKLQRADAILAISDPAVGNSLASISKFALEHKLPAIYTRSEFAHQGGLLAYGPSFATNYRRAATYVDKILKGAKPGELPVEQPTKFDLVVNGTTARALGLAMPPALLQRAESVIE